MEYPILHIIKRIVRKSENIHYINLFISFFVQTSISTFYFPSLFLISTLFYAYMRSKYYKPVIVLYIWVVFLIFFNLTDFSCSLFQIFVQFLFYRTISFSVEFDNDRRDSINRHSFPNLLSYTSYTLTIFGLFSDFFITYHNFMLLLYNKHLFVFSNRYIPLALIYVTMSYLCKKLEPSLYQFTLFCTVLFVIRRIISWKIEELSIHESTISDIESINKRDFENFTLERITKSEGISDWYTNYGYTLTIFWSKYVKRPFHIKNKLVMQALIQLSDGNKMISLLFIPELMGMMYVDKLPKVKKLKAVKKYHIVMKLIGYLQGLYISINSLTSSSIESFISVRKKTLFFYPLLSIVSIILSNNIEINDSS